MLVLHYNGDPVPKIYVDRDSKELIQKKILKISPPASFANAGTGGGAWTTRRGFAGSSETAAAGGKLLLQTHSAQQSVAAPPRLRSSFSSSSFKVLASTFS